MKHEFKDRVDRKLSHIRLQEGLKHEILQNCRRPEQRRSRRQIRWNTVVPITLCLCLICSIGAAASIPSVRNHFARILGGGYEEIAEPTGQQGSGPSVEIRENRTVVTDQGITMQVESGVWDGRTAVIYVSFQDQVGKRLDDTTDLYEYSFGTFQFLNAQLIEIWPELGKAVFCILGSAGDAGEGAVSFRASALQSGKKEYPEFSVEIDPADYLEERSESQYVPSLGGGGNKEMLDLLRDREESHVLKPGRLDLKVREDIGFVTVSNIGYLDGYLHIQTKWTDSVDNHGYLDLRGADGKRIPSISFSFDEGERDEKSKEYRSEYTEFIYDINREELESCQLRGFFVKNGEFIYGNWETSFVPEYLDKQTIQLGGVGVSEQITVTPMGVYLDGMEAEAAQDCKVSILLEDGAEAELAVRSMERRGDGKRNLVVTPREPLDLERITEIRVDGQNVYGSTDTP